MDAHASEYAAAVAGMADTYGTSSPLPAPGDDVTGLTAGKFWRGEVMSCQPGRMAVDCGGAWIVVSPRDVLSVTKKV